MDSKGLTLGVVAPVVKTWVMATTTNSTNLLL